VFWYRSHNDLTTTRDYTFESRLCSFQRTTFHFLRRGLWFIDNENSKSGLDKRMLMMFADSKVDKVRMTLLTSSESLKMSSAIFLWTIGDDHADETISIGYAWLIAAPEHIYPTKATTTPTRRTPAPTTLLPLAPPSKSSHGASETLLPFIRLNNHTLNCYVPVYQHNPLDMLNSCCLL
jgi:hypothetical protein